jgi:hypothetical protein
VLHPELCADDARPWPINIGVSATVHFFCYCLVKLEEHLPPPELMGVFLKKIICDSLN